eukprot:768677-Hanusia_phi.AAC.3
MQQPGEGGDGRTREGSYRCLRRREGRREGEGEEGEEGEEGVAEKFRVLRAGAVGAHSWSGSHIGRWGEHGPRKGGVTKSVTPEGTRETAKGQNGEQGGGMGIGCTSLPHIIRGSGHVALHTPGMAEESKLECRAAASLCQRLSWILFPCLADDDQSAINLAMTDRSLGLVSSRYVECPLDISLELAIPKLYGPSLRVI